MDPKRLRQERAVLREFREALEDRDTTLAFNILAANQDLYDQLVEIKAEFSIA